MARITDLPDAGAITGTERIPVVQDGAETGVAVGTGRVLPSIGATFPDNTAIGAMAFGTGQQGGDGPTYFDGIRQRGFQFGRPPVNSLGLGIWVVGVGRSGKPAHELGMDEGWYFWSEDGYIWNIRKAYNTVQGTLLFNGAFEQISYADGCFVAGGISGSDGFVSGNTDPRPTTGISVEGYPLNGNWQTVPPFAANGGAATTPLRITQYNTNTGEFSVNFSPGGSALVQNPLPLATGSAIDSRWPYVGQGSDGSVVLGMGKAGPVEVRVSLKQITIAPATTQTGFNIEKGLPESSPGWAGTYTSAYIQARPAGSGDFFLDTVRVIYPSTPVQLMLSGGSINSAGLVLRGLVWGIVKELAVEFAPGGT